MGSPPSKPGKRQRASRSPNGGDRQSPNVARAEAVASPRHRRRSARAAGARAHVDVQTDTDTDDDDTGAAAAELAHVGVAVGSGTLPRVTFAVESFAQVLDLALPGSTIPADNPIDKSFDSSRKKSAWVFLQHVDTQGPAHLARPSLIPSLCTHFARAGIEWRR